MQSFTSTKLFHLLKGSSGASQSAAASQLAAAGKQLN